MKELNFTIRYSVHQEQLRSNEGIIIFDDEHKIFIHIASSMLRQVVLNSMLHDPKPYVTDDGTFYITKLAKGITIEQLYLSSAWKLVAIEEITPVYF
jgi:hypothetical protein